jgi:glycosyltransferase involved in cell wall biosynthesis
MGKKNGAKKNGAKKNNNKNVTNNNKKDNNENIDEILSEINSENNNTNKNNNNTNSNLPFVSVCTPTFNRRPFIPGMIKCFNNQTYPKDRIEWIIIDDGTDKIEDLVQDHPSVKYYKYDTKLKLGKKRNMMHDKSKGDILVYMDDDDYYPPERISHAVKKLQSDSKVLCAGSSEIYIYFKHIKKMYQFGPYGPDHATAGTFAFKRKLLNTSRYDDEACLAEEKGFLKDYTVPFIQLEPLKTILVVSHEHNTFDKRKLLDNIQPKFVKESPKTVSNFIKESDLKDFYMNIDDKLKGYDPGLPSMKPDVLAQMIKIEEQRRKHAEAMASHNNGQITIKQDGKDPMSLNNDQVVQLLKQQQSELKNMQQKIDSQAKTITELQKLNTVLLTKIADKSKKTEKSNTTDNIIDID